MAKLDLRTFSQLQNGAPDPNYVAANFERIDLLSEIERDVQFGLASITGSGSTQTGLAVVEGIVVCLASSPIPQACFLTAGPGTGGLVNITVWDNAFVPSTVGASVRYIVVGFLAI